MLISEVSWLPMSQSPGRSTQRSPLNSLSLFRGGGPSPLAAVGSGSGWTVGPFSHSPQAIGVRIQPQAEAASAQTFRGTCPFHPDSQWEETIKLVFAMDFHGGPVVRILCFQ